MADPCKYFIYGKTLSREQFLSYVKTLPQNEIAEITPLMKKKVGEFSSSHFDEKNILVHIRHNTRTDAEGKKVLFLEEVQSDWGQTGKREGFVEKVDKNNIQNVREDENVWVVKFDDGSFLDISKKEAKNAEEAKALALESKKERFVSKDAKIPTAPFVTDTNAWTKLGLKVALKEAVKQGAERISWTTGEQQNERYDLSKQVDRVEHSKNGDGTYNLFVKGKEGNEVMDRLNIPENELENIIGKEIAQKIVNREGEEKISDARKGIIERGKGVESFEKNGSWYVRFESGETMGQWINKNDADKFIKTINEDYFSGKGDGTKVLSNLDLKVGGKGMKGFYGSPSENNLGIVGKVAKSLWKQEPHTIVLETAKNNEYTLGEANYVGGIGVYDGKGDMVAEFDTKKEADKFISEKQSATQHSITITPEMRLQAQEGQPLFHRTPTGEILGFAHNGKIYLNGEKITAKTTMEEAGHIWINWAKEERLDLYNAGLKKVIDSPYLKSVEANKHYQAEAEKAGKKGSKAYNDYMREEALAKAIADEGAKFVEETKRKDFKEWVRAMWREVIAHFGLKDMSTQEVAKMNLVDFAKRAAADVFQKGEANNIEADGTVRMGVSEMKSERAQIEAAAKADGTWMKAPNGKPTNLNEKQWVDVRTEAFKSWFGDWQNDPENASKVVDENGEPLVVYHGTASDFAVFDKNKVGANFKNIGRGNLGFYFTNHPVADINKEWYYGTNASEYAFNAQQSGAAEMDGANVLPVFLNIRKPIEIDANGYYSSISAIDKNESSLINRNSLKNRDGVISKDQTGEHADIAFVAFSPTQIKSATGNVGTFDPSNPDIRFNIGEARFQASTSEEAEQEQPSDDTRQPMEDDLNAEELIDLSVEAALSMIAEGITPQRAATEITTALTKEGLMEGIDRKVFRDKLIDQLKIQELRKSLKDTAAKIKGDLEARRKEAAQSIKFLLDMMRKEGVRSIPAQLAKSLLDNVANAKTEASLESTIEKAWAAIQEHIENAKEADAKAKAKIKERIDNLKQKEKDLEARRKEALDFVKKGMDALKSYGVKGIPVNAVKTIADRLTKVKTQKSLDTAIDSLMKLFERVLRTEAEKAGDRRRAKLKEQAKVNAKNNKFGDFTPAYDFLAIKEVPENMQAAYDAILENLGQRGAVVINPQPVTDFMDAMAATSVESAEAEDATALPSTDVKEDDTDVRMGMAQDVKTWLMHIADDQETMEAVNPAFASVIRRASSIPAQFLASMPKARLNTLLASVLNAQNGIMQGTAITDTLFDYEGEAAANKITGGSNAIGKTMDKLDGAKRFKKDSDSLYKHYFDTLIKSIRETPVYDIIHNITSAKSAADMLIAETNKKFVRLWKDAVRSRLNTAERLFAPASDTYHTLSVKTEIYLRELERHSNPDAGIQPISEIIDNIRNNPTAFADQFNLTDSDVERILSVFDRMDTTSPETILKSFNEQEKALVEFMINTNAKVVAPMFSFVNNALRDNPLPTTSNYSPRRGAAEESESATRFDSFVSASHSPLSFRSKSANQRASKVDFILFDPLTAFMDNLREVSYDYYMTPKVRQFNRTINKLKEQGGLASSFATHLDTAIRQSIDNDFMASDTEFSTLENTFRKLISNTKRSILIKSTRLFGEVTLNSLVTAAYAGAIRKTNKQRAALSSSGAYAKLSRDFGFVQSQRTANKFDLIDNRDIRPSRRFRSDANTSWNDFMQNNYLERAAQEAQNIFYRFSDVMAAPVHQALFLTKFQNITGSPFNADLYMSNPAYGDKHHADIRKSLAFADQRTNTMFNSAQSLETPLRAAKASKDFFRNIYENYMQYFAFNEVSALRQSFVSIFGKGIYSPQEAAALFSLLTIRAMGFQAVNATALYLLDKAVMAALDKYTDDDEDEDDQSMLRKSAIAYGFLLLAGKLPAWKKAAISLAINYLAEQTWDEEENERPYDPYTDAPLFAPNIQHQGIGAFAAPIQSNYQNVQKAFNANEDLWETYRDYGNITKEDIIESKAAYANTKLLMSATGSPGSELLPILQKAASAPHTDPSP